MSVSDKSRGRDPRVSVVVALVVVGVSGVQTWAAFQAFAGVGLEKGLIVNGGLVLSVCAALTLAVGVRALIMSAKQVRAEKTSGPWRFGQFTTTRYPKLGIILSVPVFALAAAGMWGFLTGVGSFFLLFTAVLALTIGLWSLTVSAVTLSRSRPTPTDTAGL
jgi:hypothetical protein